MWLFLKLRKLTKVSTKKLIKYPQSHFKSYFAIYPTIFSAYTIVLKIPGLSKCTVQIKKSTEQNLL